MSECGKKLRLNRICRAGRKALVVAFDHALVLGPIAGTVNPAAQVGRFTDCGVDAILMNFGVLQRAADSMLVGCAPAVILRLDWTSVWIADKSDGKLVSRLLGTVEQALRAGADAVLTYLIVGTGDAEFESGEIARNAAVARECEALGMPLIVEALARGQQVKDPLALEWMQFSHPGGCRNRCGSDQDRLHRRSGFHEGSREDLSDSHPGAGRGSTGVG